MFPEMLQRGGSMRVRVMHCLVLLLTVFFMSAGCTPSVKVIRLRPAEINLSEYKKIAVGRVRGEGGEEIASLLETTLAGSRRFEVVDRRMLEGIMREQDLSMPDSFDAKSSARLGRKMGSSALVQGRVTRHEYYEDLSKEKTTCTTNGITHSCMSYTLTGNWYLNAQLSVVDVITGRILVTKTYNRSFQNTSSSTGSRPQTTWDPGEEFTSLSEDIVGEFMKQIAPWGEEVRVYLYAAESLPTLETGIGYAKQGSWPQAIEQFTKACNTADNFPAIQTKDRAYAHYDLGIALGYSGTDYDQAIAEIRKAVELYPEEDFISEIAKIRQFKLDDARLRQQGVKPGGRQSCPILIVPMG
jgi:hypothetical protein